MLAHAKTFGAGSPIWRPAMEPEKEGPLRTGRLRSCSWCGSMHPEDLAAALRACAAMSFADRKYGWPHKSYIENVPNPHAGLLEVRGCGGYAQRGNKPGVWTERADGGWDWHEEPKPAAATTWGKFYTEHLQDATETDAETIMQAMGLRVTFMPDGGVFWQPYTKKEM